MTTREEIDSAPTERELELEEWAYLSDRAYLKCDEALGSLPARVAQVTIELLARNFILSLSGDADADTRTVRLDAFKQMVASMLKVFHDQEPLQ